MIHRPRLATVVILALAALACNSSAQAQAKPSPKAMQEWEAFQRKVLWKVGQRHVKLGMWARKLGLNAQATEQFLLVKEASDGVNTGGDFLLRLQREHGDRFWSRNLKRPPRRLLQEYDRRARDACSFSACRRSPRCTRRGGGRRGGQTPRARNQSESAKLFEAALGGELDRLQTGFGEWLRKLAVD